MIRKANQRKFIKLIINIFAVLIITLILKSFNNEVYAATCNGFTDCYWHTTLGVCTGDGGCRYVGSCSCNSYEWCVDGAWCCDKYPCHTCTPSSCDANYTTTNTGCSTYNESCTKKYCNNTSCGTVSTACYLVKKTVTYDANGGSCTPTSRTPCYGSSADAPSCSRTDYHTDGFSITSGSCAGTFNSSTGACSSVTTDMTIQVSWAPDNSAPTAPTSLLTEGQTNPTDITNITPEFSAIYNDPDSGDNAPYYEVEVNTNSSFTGTVMWDSGKTSMTNTSEGNRSPNIVYNGTTLIYDGTIYYWRIRFWDDDDAQGAWSSTANFTMDIPTSSYYEIEVNTNNTFTGTVMWDSGKTAMAETTAGQTSPELSYAGSTLSQGVTYYWRIRFWDMNDNVSTWSATAEFKLDQTPTAPKTPLTEGSANPIDVSDDTPEFSAIYDDPDTSDQANYYEIEVNTQSDFGGTVMWDSGQIAMTALNEGSRCPDISYAGDPLAAGTTYYWRIKFWDLAGLASPWSSTVEEASFIMSGPPVASALLTVGETNPTQILFDPYFSAIYTDPNNNDSSAYQIQVNTTSGFDGTTMWDSTKTSATITSGNRSSDISYNGTTLSYDGTTYYIRMKFWDTDDNEGDWVTGQFTDTLKSFQFNGLQIDGIQLN